MADTREQQLAMCFDRHMAVTANAGSGKTRVLVNRYLNILLNHEIIYKGSEGLRTVNTSGIVAITFTRKAASEMLSKVVNGIEELISKAGDRTVLERLAKIREELTYARVSTIHSFCAGLLRDYPIEAGVLPNFTELSDAEIMLLKRESILNTLEERLVSTGGSLRQETLDVLDNPGRGHVENLVFRLIEKADIMRKLKSFYERGDASVTGGRDEYLWELFISTTTAAFRIFREHLQKIDTERLKPDKARQVGPGIKSIEEYLYYLGSGIENHSAENLASQINAVKAIFDVFFTGTLTLRQKFAKGLEYEDLKQQLNDAAASFKMIFEMQEFLQYAEYDNDMLRRARIIMNIAEEALAAFDEEKLELGGIDFNDMMIKALELLKNEENAAKVREKIDYLLVDEFQDTDSLQYEIIQRLVPDLEDINFDGHSPNLFIVGDAKQSIYAFRNADVRVFSQAIEDIKKTNARYISKGILGENYLAAEEAGTGEKSGIKVRQIYPAGEDEKLGDINLTATFRLQPVISSFVNKVCTPLMKKETEYDVEYDDFVCARNAELIGSNDFTGAVDLIFHVKPYLENGSGSNDEEESGGDESDLIAKYIKNIVDNDDYLVDDKGSKRKIRYKDIAVLARAGRKFPVMAEALLDNKVPYIIHSGGGFFNTQEIMDLISYLNFLNNPRNNLALISILRSPFFGISNTGLFNLSCEQGASYREKLDSYCRRLTNGSGAPPAGSDNELFLRAKNILDEMLGSVSAMPLPQLINKMLSLSGYYGTITRKPDRKHISANIEKFISIARDFENRGFTGFFDFVDEMNFLSSESLKEPEAVTLSDEDTVNIMTIHASKGLEFPVVILYDTNSGTRGRSESAYIDEFTGLTFPLTIDYLHKTKVVIKTPLHYISKIQNNISSDTEEKRILYVAMTRAMDRLVIGASLKTLKRGNIGKPAGYLDMIINSLGLETDKLMEAEEFHIRDKISILGETGTEEKLITYPVSVIRDIKEKFTSIQKSGKASGQARYRLDDIRLHYNEEYFSPSKFTLFLDDEEEYIRRYIFGLTSTDDNLFEAPIYSADSGEDSIIGTLAGSLIHEVLENISHWIKDGSGPDLSLLSETIDRIISNKELVIRESLKSRLLKECGKVASTPLIKNFASAFPSALTEYDLIMPAGEEFINAKPDLIIKDKAGKPQVWDWKTNKVSSKDDMARLAKHYETQMKMYCYMVKLLYPGFGEYHARLLFTRLAGKDAPDEKWTYVFSWTSEELDEFYDYIQDVIKRIKGLIII